MRNKNPHVAQTISIQQGKNSNCCVRLRKSQLINRKTSFQHRARSTVCRVGRRQREKREFQQSVGCAAEEILPSYAPRSYMIWNSNELMVCICFSPNRSILSAKFFFFVLLLSGSPLDGFVNLSCWHLIVKMKSKFVHESDTQMFLSNIKQRCANKKATGMQKLFIGSPLVLPFIHLIMHSLALESSRSGEKFIKKFEERNLRNGRLDEKFIFSLTNQDSIIS